MKTTPPQPARRGATLIEVLVVFAILSVLAGLLMTVLTRVRESANELTCRSNLKDLASISTARPSPNISRPGRWEIPAFIGFFVC